MLSKLKQLSTHYKIGHLLFCSRKPDFCCTLWPTLWRTGSFFVLPVTAEEREKLSPEEIDKLKEERRKEWVRQMDEINGEKYKCV